MESLAEFERMARAVKERAVRRDGPRSEIEPQVILFRRGRYFASALVGAPSRAEWLLRMKAAVAISCADAVVQLSEGYMKAYDELADMESDDVMERLSESYEHGDLATRHGAGDVTVAEVLLVNVYRHGHPPAVTSTPFVCRGRAVEWGERLEPDETEGEVPDLIAGALAIGVDRAARLGPLPWLEFAAAMLALNIPVEVAPPVSHPRNAPCPCGSGRKHKICCGATS